MEEQREQSEEQQSSLGEQATKLGFEGPLGPRIVAAEGPLGPRNALVDSPSDRPGAGESEV